MRLDQGDQIFPWHHLIHLDQARFLAGLLALAGVLGASDVHLLHRKLGGYIAPMDYEVDRFAMPWIGSETVGSLS